MHQSLAAAPELIRSVSDSIDILFLDGADLTGEFAAFDWSLDALVANCDAIRGHTMVLHHMSEQQNLAKQTLDALQREADSSCQAFGEWVHEVNNLRTQVKHELNAGKIASSSNMVRDIKADTDGVIRLLQSLMDNLDKVVMQVLRSRGQI